ncbi:MAG: hypothetical protein JSS49_18850 [Planctomycetes bacterium]|nr:hypothetical protein [Planctomycetota bacterium]
MATTATRFAAVILFGAGLAAAADKPLPKGAAVYEKFPEAIRPELLKEYAMEVKELETALSKAKRSLAKARGPIEREKAASVRDAAQSELSEMMLINDPPHIGARLKWTVGSIGKAYGDQFTVGQVTGKSSAVMLHPAIKPFHLTGVDTTDWVDGDRKEFDEPLWISGTVTAGTATVMVVEPFDWDKYRKANKIE